MPKAFALPLTLLKTLNLKNAFKTAESRFILFTGFKFAAICLATLFIVGYQLYVNARLNFYFFQAHGLGEINELKEAYFDYLISGATDMMTITFFFIVTVFFVGLYIAVMILRPFKNIGEYSVRVLDHPNTPYQVDQFAGHRLLTRFSELFFDYLQNSRTSGKLEERNIPTQYMGIHGPVFDGAFLFHFSFFIAMMTIVSVVVIMHVATNIHESTIQLAIKMLKADPKVLSSFFHAQTTILDELWIIAAVLICILNLMLGLHLYNSVSGAAFGIFATMRSFIKGNHSARVHLVGFGYLRDSTRSLNKYLDWIQKNLAKKP